MYIYMLHEPVTLISFLFQSDVLNNFGTDNVAANIARLLLAITMFLTYPLVSCVAFGYRGYFGSNKLFSNI